jgi:putative transposase
VVFTSKYGRKVIELNMASYLKDALFNICKDFGFTILDSDIAEDYVRLVISCSPRLGIMNCVNRIKSMSARGLKDMFPELS